MVRKIIDTVRIEQIRQEGISTYLNDLFCSLRGYKEEEIVKRPHGYGYNAIQSRPSEKEGCQRHDTDRHMQDDVPLEHESMHSQIQSTEQIRIHVVDEVANIASAFTCSISYITTIKGQERLARIAAIGGLHCRHLAVAHHARQ